MTNNTDNTDNTVSPSSNTTLSDLAAIINAANATNDVITDDMIAPIIASCTDHDHATLSLLRQMIVPALRTQKQFAKLLNDVKKLKYFGRPIRNAVDLVEWYADVNDLHVTMTGYRRGDRRCRMIGDSIVTPEDYANASDADRRMIDIVNPSDVYHMHIVTTLATMCIRHNLYGITEAHINNALLDYTYSRRILIPAQIYQSIRYDHVVAARSDAQWHTLVSTMFDGTINPPEFYINILKKFIHQVKNKMLGRNVNNHIMPILLGPQGVGKSKFLENLVSPLKDLTKYSTMSDIVDDRMIDLWTDASIIVLDEMQYASRADIDAVKHVVTANTLTRRPMRTNAIVNVRQGATLIGASNRALDDLIVDTSGIRRFVGLDFIGTTDPEKYKIINNINYVELWQSVNEEGADYLVEIKEIISKRQAECTARATVADAYYAGYFNDLWRAGKPVLIRDIIAGVEQYKLDHGLTRTASQRPKSIKNDIKQYLSDKIEIIQYDRSTFYRVMESVNTNIPTLNGFDHAISDNVVEIKKSPITIVNNNLPDPLTDWLSAFDVDDDF